ncbi:MAG: DUF2975 domain-containing protein [Clostridiales bacterium]|nr:DUF2975 domain-containing protein [Candidatus Equinaster intestinalis]
MWNSKKSINLSLVCVYVFMVIFVLLEIFAFPISDFYVEFLNRAPEMKQVLIISIYACLLPVGYALILLYKLLCSIKNDQIFTDKNIVRLRHLSWCCYVVAVVCIVCGIKCAPYFILAPMAAFAGLILRVVKNACQRAKELQDENEMTI